MLNTFCVLLGSKSLQIGLIKLAQRKVLVVLVSASVYTTSTIDQSTFFMCLIYLPFLLRLSGWVQLNASAFILRLSGWVQLNSSAFFTETVRLGTA